MNLVEMIKAKLFWTGLIPLLLFFGCETKEESEYLDSLNLELKGVIEFMEIPHHPSNGFGVMDVAIINSNISYYEPRQKREIYYCVIINNRAQFYPGDMRECDFGDTVEVSTKDRLFLVHKKDGRVLEKEMRLYDNEQFYRYVRKHYDHF